jgi:hypothetical protein
MRNARVIVCCRDLTLGDDHHVTLGPAMSQRRAATKAHGGFIVTRLAYLSGIAKRAAMLPRFWGVLLRLKG